MNYEKKYKEALGWMQSLYNGLHGATKEDAEHYFPELKKSEDEIVISALKSGIKFLESEYKIEGLGGLYFKKILAWLEKQCEPQDKGEISDGYHTFNELYYYRMLYNAAFFNMLPKEWVHKSKRHNDGEECFGGGWFIVMANLPTGQVSNHYELKDWDLFQIPEKEVADRWDGHTPQEAADRLYKYLLEKQGEKKPTWSEEDEHRCEDTIYFLDTAKKHYADTSEIEKAIDWLKSIKNRVGCEVNCTTTKQWSDEDEKILGKCIDAASGYYSPEDKQSMKEWLKSLKDRVKL